jgi:transcription-repair coupling factor (superfamily II helicase)
MKIRIELKRLLIREIECDGQSLILSFHQKTPVSPDTILGLIRRNQKKYRFTPDFKLVCALADSSFDGILLESRNLLKTLAQVC